MMVVAGLTVGKVGAGVAACVRRPMPPGWSRVPGRAAWTARSPIAEALRRCGLGLLDFAKGDTDVAAPSVLGRPYGVNPQAVSGAYQTGGSINLGTMLGGVLKSLGYLSNQFGVSFFIQGFGLGGSLNELLDAGFSTAGAGVSVGLAGGFAFGITPPLKKYMPI